MSLTDCDLFANVSGSTLCYITLCCEHSRAYKYEVRGVMECILFSVSLYSVWRVSPVMRSDLSANLVQSVAI